MENWRSYKFFDGWIMKKIEHTYNFNFKNKYRRNQPVSECKYTYCCDSLDNSLSLCEETSFYSSETPNMRKDRRKLRRKKLVKKMKRNDDRYNRYSSSDSEEEYLRRKRQKYQRIFIHQKIIYDEYVTKKDRKFYPTRLKMLSHERWNEELLKKKEREEKMDAHDKDEKEEKSEAKGKKDREEQQRMEKDEKENEKEVKEESIRPYPPPQLAQPPLPPPPLPPPPPPPPPPPLPPPPAVRLLAVNSTGYLPVQQVTAAPTPDRQYNEQLPYGTIAGIAYEIPVDITYIIGCNAVFRQF